MTEIISVRFKEGGKSYYFNPDGIVCKVGDGVIIETSRGIEFGECVEANRMIDEMELVSPLRPVVRLATKEDYVSLQENKGKEAHAFEVCQAKILEHELDMKLVEVEYNFDGSKILFFFTSEGRVDFRGLVRDLAAIFHTRIELRQIGVRDEAKMLGGLGICGRPFCCSSFLDDFHPVSIKMAKTQNLSLNPTKISGVCGRLMCCLKYEQDAYDDVVKRVPKQDSFVDTPDGVGDVISVQLLREKVKVRLDNDPDNPKIYSVDQITVIRNGKGKRPEGYERKESSGPAPRNTPLRNPISAPAEKKPAAEVPAEKGAEERPARPARPQRPAKPVRKETPEVREVPVEERSAPTAEEPKPQTAPESGEEKKPQRNNNNRNRHRRGNKPRSNNGDAPAQQSGEKKSSPRPPKGKKPEGTPGQKPEGKPGEGGKPHHRRPPRKHHKPHGGNGGNGGAPKAE